MRCRICLEPNTYMTLLNGVPYCGNCEILPRWLRLKKWAYTRLGVEWR